MFAHNCIEIWYGTITITRTVKEEEQEEMQNSMKRTKKNCSAAFKRKPKRNVWNKKVPNRNNKSPENNNHCIKDISEFEVSLDDC